MESSGEPGGGRRKKTMVIGLDGVPYSLLQRLREMGRIPDMNALFGQGSLGRMSVSVPEISSVSWSSFMTGTQPGNHGIFGFVDLEPGSYKIRLPNFNDLRGKTIWDELAESGKKSVVINMPSTYPARKMDGALISGFVAVDINRAVHPAALLPRLKEAGYRTDLDLVRARRDPDFLIEELHDTLAGRKQAVSICWDEIDWDLFIVVVTGTDRLMHYLWDALEDENHRHHGAFLDYFDAVDRFVGWAYDRFTDGRGNAAEDRSFFMLSDHGFTGIQSEVYLNTWLERAGYLKFATPEPKSIMEIGPGSKAFALDPSRIHINVKGKYPLGAVERGDVESILREIEDGLRGLKTPEGRPVAREIHRKERIYSGPFFDNAPDLVVLSHHGYDLKGKVSAPDVFGRTDLQGMHTQDDAFFYTGNGTACGTIFEAKEAVLASL